MTIRVVSARYEGPASSVFSVNCLKTSGFFLSIRWHTACYLPRWGTRKMRTTNYIGKIGRAILAFSLMLGIGFMMSLTVQAQDRNNRQWQRHDRSRIDSEDQNRDWRRDGNRNQDADRRRARRDDRYNIYGNTGSYGRNRVYGNNGSYRNNNGNYNNGNYNNRNYNNGVYNNGNYNNSQIALNQGYQAGINTGASDAQRGQSYSPQRSHYYRNASSQSFRNGFVRGYDAGFRQYGYNNGGYRTGNTGFGSILGGILG